MIPACVPPTQSSAPVRVPLVIESPLLDVSSPPAPADDRVRVDRYLRAFLAESRRKHGTNSQTRPLFDHISEFVLCGGKRLRPRLALASYRIMSGFVQNPPRSIWRASASLELFHAFMLVHDDLIDGSLLRRGKPTLHEAIRLGSSPAHGCDGSKRAGDLGMIGGDLLCALGMRLIGRSGLDDAPLGRTIRLISEMLLETGIGEALDVLFEECPLANITESQILDAYLRKTARYTVSGPLIVGASLAGAEQSLLKSLRRYGDLMGLAFQIQNDLDGLAHDDKTGECPDLDAGKRTWILWTAYDRLSECGRRELNQTLSLPIGPARREGLLSLIVASGALEIAEERVGSLQRDALAVLLESRLEAAQRSAFLGLLTLFSDTPGRSIEVRS